MPVVVINCAECGNQYRSLILEGAKVPELWDCSGCGGRNARPIGADDENKHPWATNCMDACCG